MSGRPVWPFACAAGGLVLFVVALLAWTRAPVPGAGFEQRSFAGAGCTGASVTSLAREPFIRATSRGDGRCVRWSAQMVARTKMRARIEMASEPAGRVAIDGQPVVVDDEAHAARTRVATVELARGVHSFVAEHTGAEGAGAYFRLALVDELAPHNYEFAPPLDRSDFFATSEDASRAIATPEDDAFPRTSVLTCVALAGAAVLAWLAVRRRRDLPVPVADLAIAAALFLAALTVRAHGIRAEDTTWDELTYVDTAAHWVRSLALGDFHPEAWRYNLSHPPNTKWLLAIGVALGGQMGARVFSAALSAGAVAFVFAFGRLAFGRAVGASSGALAVFLPLWVAHGRIAGHESVVLFWWCGSMLALAVWVRSLRRVDGVVGRSDPVAAFACVFAATMGVFSRANVAWILPVLVTVLVATNRRVLRRSAFAVPFPAVAGGVAGVCLTAAGWPYLWMRPKDQLSQLALMLEGAKPRGDIEVYLGKLTTPAWHYFVVAFVAETPALLLVAACAGVVVTMRAPRLRGWGAVCILWLALPFAQSVSTLRIGAGRYVIQAWPALLLFASVGMVSLGGALSRFVAARGDRAIAFVRSGVPALGVAYTGAALFVVEPYPLDYFDELVGGPSGVAARRMFEVPWWGEGNLAAVQAVNATAPAAARVHLGLWPKHVLGRLRDDLIAVDDAAIAEYVALSHLQYFERPPPACARLNGAEAEGAPLTDVYQCVPANPTQLGFGAMHDAARVDEAVAHFRDALKLDPGDAGAIFGLGWAAQVKGDLPRAEAQYVAAAFRASQVHDAETEYFARYDLGTLYRQQGNVAQAAESFRAALALRPNEASALDALRSLTAPRLPVPAASTPHVQ